MKANEKTSLLSRFTNHTSSSNGDDDDEELNSRWCSYKALRRGGIVALIIVQIVLAIRFGVFKKGGKIFRAFTVGMPGPYSKTQVLGFQIHTGGAPAIINGTNELNEECIRTNRYGLLAQDSDEPESMCYVGLSDPIEDAKERVNVMRASVEQAYVVADQDPTVLKIFVAPEFFFRGIDGAYAFDGKNEIDNCGPICIILTGLEGIVADKRFEDWFFVFGSIVAYDTLPKGHKFEYLFYNVAPIYRGYDPLKTDSHGKMFLLPKRYTSNLDFLTPERNVKKNTIMELIHRTLPSSNHTLVNPFDIDQAKYNDKVWFDYKDAVADAGYTMIEYDWMILDDITISIEICFDHYRSRALQTYMADFAAGNVARIPSFSAKYDTLQFVPIPKNLAQVSIVSSSGMTINPDSIALTNNGTLYLQDGLYDDEASLVWKEDGERIEETLGGSEALQREPVVTNTNVYFKYRIVPVTKKVSVYPSEAEWKSALGGTFSTVLYEPMIVIWPTQPIVPV